MLHVCNKSGRYLIVLVILGTAFCLLAAWQVFIKRSELRYLCELAFRTSLNTKQSALVTPRRSMVGRRSDLTLNNFLNATHPELSSPSGRFVLRLEPSGDLRYLQVLEADRVLDPKNTNALTKTFLFEKSLFSTSTGDSWPGEHIVDLNAIGVLRVQVKATFMSERKTTWTSSMLSHCKRLDSANSSLVLAVVDSGLLAIYPHRESSEPLCVLHREVIYRSNRLTEEIVTRSKGRAPRLAMVIAGFFRTNKVACDSHVKKIIQKWEQTHRSSVDVFIFTYVQDAHLPDTPLVSNATILAALQACYQSNLKVARVRNVGEVEETFSYVPASEIKQCGPKLNRLQSQLKTVYLAGQLMRNHMLSEGITYDYVVRLRPDTDLWGNIPDLPVFGASDDETRIFLPHPYREHYYWCSHHDGRIRTGVTDQLAYGTLPTMLIYLNMYLEFADMVRTITGHPTSNSKRAKYNSMACEGTVGDRGCDQPDADGCAIECLVSYYLVLHGLEPEVLWTWQQNVLRVGGSHSKTCGRPFNC